MDLIKFTTLPQGDKVASTNSAEHILLSYFLSDMPFPASIEERIEELETIESGGKTFEEVMGKVYGEIPVGMNGYFECDQKTAYFKSHTSEPSFQMPLKDLISILKQWKAFLS